MPEFSERQYEIDFRRHGIEQRNIILGPKFLIWAEGQDEFTPAFFEGGINADRGGNFLVKGDNHERDCKIFMIVQAALDKIASGVGDDDDFEWFGSIGKKIAYQSKERCELIRFFLNQNDDGIFHL